MAQRFGGKFSPGAANRPAEAPVTATPARVPRMQAKRPTPAGARVNILFILALPLVFMAFGREPAGLAMSLGAYGLIALAAWLTREGLIAEDAYAVRRVARRPALPRKILGAVAMGLGIGLAAFVEGHGVVGTGILAVIGGGLHLTAFGLDPMKDKVADGIDTFQTERVAEVVEEAEGLLTQMRDHIRRLNDRQLVGAVDAFQGQVRELIATVENDPRRLTAARRYLGVYLVGARDASDRFAELFARTRDGQARTDYLSLLADLETNFANLTQALLRDDRTALDIEMDVLRERLQREGVRPD